MKRSAYRRRRCTRRLKPGQVAGLKAADVFSGKLGNHLNTFMTISWGHTNWRYQDFDARHLSRRLLEFRRRLVRWLKDHDAQLFWIYVRENPAGNVHTHFLIHVPPKLASEFVEAIEFIAGAKTDTAVDVRPRNLPGEFRNRLDYMCKGTDTVTARQFGIGNSSDQGVVNCKRCGWTENLGQRAQKTLKQC